MISDQGIFEILNLSPVIVSDLDRKDSKLVLSQKTLEELSEKLHFKVSSGTVYNLSEKFLLNKSSKDTLANKILEEESLIYKNSVGPDSKNIPILMFGKYEFNSEYRVCGLAVPEIIYMRRNHVYTGTIQTLRELFYKKSKLRPLFINDDKNLYIRDCIKNNLLWTGSKLGILIDSKSIDRNVVEIKVPFDMNFYFRKSQGLYRAYNLMATKMGELLGSYVDSNEKLFTLLKNVDSLDLKEQIKRFSPLLLRPVEPLEGYMNRTSETINYVVLKNTKMVVEYTELPLSGFNPYS